MEDLFIFLSNLPRNPTVSYREIKRALDPLNIIRAGQILPDNSVEYFILAWSAAIRTYEHPDELLYDVEDWLTALVGPEHAQHYLQKFSHPAGFFMESPPTYMFWPSYTQGDKRRWAGSLIGMRAIAIHLCSQRGRKGLSRTRIDQHASYIAHEVCLVEKMKRFPAWQAAVEAFANGEQLDVWEETIEQIEGLDKPEQKSLTD